MAGLMNKLHFFNVSSFTYLQIWWNEWTFLKIFSDSNIYQWHSNALKTKMSKIEWIPLCSWSQASHTLVTSVSSDRNGILILNHYPFHIFADIIYAYSISCVSSYIMNFVPIGPLLYVKKLCRVAAHVTSLLVSI